MLLLRPLESGPIFLIPSSQINCSDGRGAADVKAAALQIGGFPMGMRVESGRVYDVIKKLNANKVVAFARHLLMIREYQECFRRNIRNFELFDKYLNIVPNCIVISHRFAPHRLNCNFDPFGLIDAFWTHLNRHPPPLDITLNYIIVLLISRRSPPSPPHASMLCHYFD